MPILMEPLSQPGPVPTHKQSSPDASATNGASQRFHHHRALICVLVAYLLTTLIVPFWTPVAIGDDWVYTRSVETLLKEHRLYILDLSVVTLLFQVVWGAFFAFVLSPFVTVFAATRLATVVMVGLGGWAFYGLCRELDIPPRWSALGALMYLFNPLNFVLAYTFMSDAYFTALLVISVFFYTHGLRKHLHREMRSATDVAPSRYNAVIVGSAVASLAFLVRQQGILIPMAVVVYLLLQPELRFSRRGVLIFAQVIALPIVTVTIYYLWLKFVRGIPKAQQDFLQRVVEAGWEGAWQLVTQLAFIEGMYLGLFVLPLSLAALPVVWRAIPSVSLRGWLLFLPWCGVIVWGLLVINADGRRMPYIPHYASLYGLGPYDLYGGRPWLIDGRALDFLTALCATASLVFGFILCHRLAPRKDLKNAAARAPDRVAAGLLITVAIWQAIGVLPASFSFRHWTFRDLIAPSLDRYLLPLMPLVICLGLWALYGLCAAPSINDLPQRDVPRRLCVSSGLALLAASILALFSIVGTRDSLVFQSEVWNMARAAHQSGILLTKLDAGAAWDGYHLYEYSIKNRITTQSRGIPEKLGVEWWLHLFAPAVDSTYIVSGSPLPGYNIVRKSEYSAWLNPRPVYLYLLRYQPHP